MFENVSEKIKSVAYATAILGILTSVIGGLFLLSDDDTMLIGLIVAGLGSLFSWIIAIFIYGFGELLEKVCVIEENTRNNRNDIIDENPQIADEDNTDEIGISNFIDVPPLQ